MADQAPLNSIAARDTVGVPASGSSSVPAHGAAKKPWLSIQASIDLADWLVEQKISIAFTTYHTGKLLFLGISPNRRLAIFDRNFSHCMGLCADPDGANTLWISTLFQLWRLQNTLDQGKLHDGHDRLYVPLQSYTTGDLDIHDVAVEQSGRVVFVSTGFSCLATTSQTRNFKPLWKPPTISELKPEDRCHLNGLALEGGRAAYVTACSTSDMIEGWRNVRQDGGIVMDVRTNHVIVGGLSMPHSPRLHDGKIYLHSSGTGHFGRIDRARGIFEPICFCPGYLRGLAFWRDYAIVGVSKPREQTFAGLALDDELARRNASPQCGLLVIDLRKGEVIHSLKLEDPLRELYDVAVLPGVSMPMALGFQTDEINRTFTFENMGRL